MKTPSVFFKIDDCVDHSNDLLSFLEAHKDNLPGDLVIAVECKRRKLDSIIETFTKMLKYHETAVGDTYKKAYSHFRKHHKELL